MFWSNQAPSTPSVKVQGSKNSKILCGSSHILPILVRFLIKYSLRFWFMVLRFILQDFSSLESILFCFFLVHILYLASMIL